MGTHDLDKIVCPLYYDARCPSEISFVPLNKSSAVGGPELLDFYEVGILNRHSTIIIIYSADTTIYFVLLI